MATKKTFTPASIDAVSQGVLRDPQTPGLFIEILPSGKKRWKYRRLIHRSELEIRLSFGLFPTRSIADAREWADGLNAQVEQGVDPREVMRADEERAGMTVARAHGLYMIAVREGRASRAKRRNKPRTISDKLEIYRRDIATKLGNRSVYEIAEDDLVRLVAAKGKTAKVRANRLAAELMVFFRWASSLRGLEVGLNNDPSRRLGDLKFPESPRQRKLSREEIGWFLQAVAEEERDFRRGYLVLLLTGARLSEVVLGRSEEVTAGVWTVPAGRSKNSKAHVVALGPWGRSLMATNSEWLFPAERVEGPRRKPIWYKVRDRILTRMSALAGRPLDRFTPHDLRRTVRSNTKRLKVDFETAEAMMNHLKTGMERIYDGYELEEEKAAAFLTWEAEVGAIARGAGVADKLGVPLDVAPSVLDTGWPNDTLSRILCPTGPQRELVASNDSEPSTHGLGWRD
jgi:integrase